MFTVDSRDALRTELIEMGRADPRVTGVAITGSASVGNEDRWSDIDLGFGVNEGSEVDTVLRDFSTHMYGCHQALHHLDVRSGKWIYRVFLLANTLQVDLAFVPASDFAAKGPTFKLVCGTAAQDQYVPSPKAEDLIGWGWLYALHARSSIVRGKAWQAEYMVSGVRDQVLALACLRLRLPTREGRGMDRLPEDVAAPLEEALVRSLEPGELQRAFQVATAGLLREIEEVDVALGLRLERTLRDLAELPDPPS